MLVFAGFVKIAADKRGFAEIVCPHTLIKTFAVSVIAISIGLCFVFIEWRTNISCRYPVAATAGRGNGRSGFDATYPSFGGVVDGAEGKI